MPFGQMRRRSQSEIRDGKAPRRLADRSAIEHMNQVRWHSGAAYLTGRWRLRWQCYVW
jgi:hypothetical protein